MYNVAIIIDNKFSVAILGFPFFAIIEIWVVVYVLSFSLTLDPGFPFQKVSG